MKFKFKEFKDRMGKPCRCKVPLKENVCPCKEFLTTQKCICGLFLSE